MASVDVNKNKFLEGQNPTLMKEFGVFFEKLSNKYIESFQDDSYI